MNEYQEAFENIQKAIHKHKTNQEIIDVKLDEALTLLSTLVSATQVKNPYQKGYATAKAKYEKDIKQMKAAYDAHIPHLSSVYPYNLVQTILDNLSIQQETQLKNAYCGTLMFAIEQIQQTMLQKLTERERTVIEQTYKYRKTDKQLAEELYIHLGYVQHIQQTALRKLSQTSVLQDMMVVPYRDYQKLHEQYQDLATNKSDMLPEEKEQYYLNKLMQTPIEDLSISVRTYNCLKREQIHTVQNIIEHVKIHGTLTNIRNLGRHALSNLVGALDLIHVDIRPYLTDKTEGNP